LLFRCSTAISAEPIIATFSPYSFTEKVLQLPVHLGLCGGLQEDPFFGAVSHHTSRARMVAGIMILPEKNQIWAVFDVNDDILQTNPHHRRPISLVLSPIVAKQ
jgi:hypothetical protein